MVRLDVLDGSVAGTVVNQDDFKVGEGLLLKTFQAVGQMCCTIPIDNDDRNAPHRGRF
jgi:hypothetical protein